MIDGASLLDQIRELRAGGYRSDAVMREMVKQLKAAEPRYNFVGIYLLDPEAAMLWLHNYAGEPTDHARIPVGSGVCGTAVAEKANQNVPDVTQVGNYLSCSPRTKSELVVLIRNGDDIFGQIDIDAKELDAFPAADQQAIESVADRIAEIIVRERGDSLRDLGSFTAEEAVTRPDSTSHDNG